MATRKTKALTIWIFVGKVMSLLLNMLSRSVITFLPRSKCFLISWLQSPSSVILEPRKIKRKEGRREAGRRRGKKTFLTQLFPLATVLREDLESPLDCKEIQPVHSEGDQPWDFFGRNDAKAETPVLWPPHAKSWLIGKDPDAGKYWRQEDKGMTEDEMVGWHHRLNGHEFG